MQRTPEMKILYSCLSKSWGGMEMFTLDASLKLIERGIPTELLCFPGSRIHSEAEKKGIKTYQIEASGYFNPGQIIKLSRILIQNKFSHIHTQASKDLWVIVPSLNLISSAIPLILTKQVGSFIVKKDFLHKWIYKRVTLALAISEVIKTNLIETCPLPAEKVRIMHNGVDINRFDPAKTNRNQMRAEFGIHESEIVLGMLARFSPGKGHEDFLLAARELIRLFSNLKFMIVGEPSRGEGEYGSKIKQMASELGLNDNVIFTGFRKDTPEIITAMDIFVFPSHNEAFGIALVEAMAMEKPSVCTASDGVLDIAVDDSTSYLFRKGDRDELVQKLSLLIKSPEKRIQFGRNARQRVIDLFDIEKLTDKVIKVYEDLVN